MARLQRMLCHGVKAVPAVLLAGSKTALITKPNYPANAPNRPAPDLFQMAQLVTGLAHVRHQGCHVQQAGDFWDYSLPKKPPCRPGNG